MSGAAGKHRALAITVDDAHDVDRWTALKARHGATHARLLHRAIVALEGGDVGAEDKRRITALEEERGRLRAQLDAAMATLDAQPVLDLTIPLDQVVLGLWQATKLPELLAPSYRLERLSWLRLHEYEVRLAHAYHAHFEQTRHPDDLHRFLAFVQDRLRPVLDSEYGVAPFLTLAEATPGLVPGVRANAKLYNEYSRHRGWKDQAELAEPELVVRGSAAQPEHSGNGHRPTAGQL